MHLLLNFADVQWAPVPISESPLLRPAVLLPDTPPLVAQRPAGGRLRIIPGNPHSPPGNLPYDPVFRSLLPAIPSPADFARKCRPCPCTQTDDACIAAAGPVRHLQFSGVLQLSWLIHSSIFSVACSGWILPTTSPSNVATG